jgi:chromosome partitioning protein
VIIALLNTKGGCGKTTTTFNLCDSFARKNKKVLAIDCDHRQALITVCKSLQEGDKLRFAATKIKSLEDIENIKTIESEYDYVLIDTDPVLEDIQRNIILMARMVIIPITPSPLDYIEAQKTINILLQGKQYNENLQIFCLMNRFSQRRRNSNILLEQLNILKEYDVKIFKQTIGDRTSFSNLMIGSSYDLERNGKGTQEIDNLTKEISAILRRLSYGEKR